ncbi:WXG100 family type VII secretion target [Nocardia sp. NPDC059177]|uniref:WXG100 family type VII secretion target n=1 Tax=Nocardia sp. NPDC059177 TaxID=3346759 RepID=UPI003691AFD7
MAAEEWAGADFAVVPAEVTDAGKYVQLVAESLVNGLRSLDSDITALLETWKGYSAEMYGTAWIETKQGADEVLEALSTMARLLGVTSQTLSDQDTARAAAHEPLASTLDLPGL